MKNSKEYSRKVQKLYRSLKRKYGRVQDVTYDEPVEALVCAIVSENITEKAARSAMRRFADYFIDLNDLRVSRADEIVEVLGSDTPVTRDIALTLSGALSAVFDKYNTISLKAMKRISKRPAKQALEKMNGVSPFVLNYCMVTSLEGHAIPLTRKMMDYLRSEELVHPGADEEEIEGFLARQISAESGYEFYVLLRRESESYKPKRKTARIAKTKATPKSEKKKKATRTRTRKK